MAQLREIKRRIKTSKNISQVTRAMETVSAVKMRKAKDMAVVGKEYTETIEKMVKVLVGQTEREQQSVYLKQPEFVKNILVIVIAPKKGLCGSLIGNLQRAVANFVLKNKVHEDANFSFVTIGKKSFDIVKVFNKSVLADFTVSERDLDANSIEPTIDFVVEKLTDKTIDTVFVAYTEFINTMTQKPVIKQFLPIPPQEVEAENDKKEQDSQFIFEPNSSEVLDSLVIRYTKSILYQYLLESIASEHSARMVAMKSAHDSADEIVTDLSLYYNKIRQNSITTELADSVSSRLGQE